VYYLFLTPSLTPAFNGLCPPLDSTVIGGLKPSREGSRREDAGGSEKVKALKSRFEGQNARVRLVINGS